MEEYLSAGETYKIERFLVGRLNVDKFGRVNKLTADAQILIFKIKIERFLVGRLNVFMVGRVKKSTADAQILIFKIWKNIYPQMKPIK